MSKLVLIVIFLTSAVFSVSAQKLTPEFELASSDLTAQLQPRKDMNDRNCALVKVQFVGEVLDVEGNVVQPLSRRSNEVWVYMPQNSRQVKVITKNYLPIMVTFADFGVEKLESNRTYVLVLNQKGNVAQTVQHNAQSTAQNKPTSSNSSSNTSGSTMVIPVKNGISIEMVKVKAGTFIMGGTKEIISPENDEYPIHQVSLTQDYYIGKFEVTQDVWEAVMGCNISRFKGNKLPVERISWFDCQEFIRQLNRMTGKNFRLPTEAEWEYAARGGKKTHNYQYSGSNQLSKIAWFVDNSDFKTHPVGKKKANELGIFDMSGNVYEWCQDWYGSYTESSQTNPIGPSFGEKKVVRGGCCLYIDTKNTVSNRESYSPNDSFSGLGFRLVLSEL